MLLLHCLFIKHAMIFVSFFSSSWCQGLAAACVCGTPWTFLLFFLCKFIVDLINKTVLISSGVSFGN